MLLFLAKAWGFCIDKKAHGFMNQIPQHDPTVSILIQLEITGLMVWKLSLIQARRSGAMVESLFSKKSVIA